MGLNEIPRLPDADGFSAITTAGVAVSFLCHFFPCGNRLEIGDGYSPFLAKRWPDLVQGGGWRYQKQDRPVNKISPRKSGAKNRATLRCARASSARFGDPVPSR
jgi:hypothetical protein